MGVTTEVIAAAVQQAGLETSDKIVEIDPARVMTEVDVFRNECQCFYRCPCLDKNLGASPIHRPAVFTMHASRYVEGTQHPLKPAGVMTESRMYGVWVGQCPECRTIYVAQREL